MSNPPTVFIIVPVFNRCEVTQKFANNVRRQTYSRIQLIVVDDASPDGTAEILQKQYADWDALTILNSGGDSWWGGSVYLGIEEALKMADKTDCVLLMNDDNNFDNDLVEDFVKAHKRWPNAVLGALTMVNGLVHNPGSNMLCWPLALSGHPYNGMKWTKRKLPEIIPIQFQFAQATLYPINVIQTIGNIEHTKLPHYHGDGEYSYRAVRYGFPSYVVSSILIFPDTNSTGLFNSFTTRQRWSDLIPSFFRFKSINNIRHRWHFAELCCPAIWRYPYIASDLMKSLIRSILMLLRNR